MFDLIWHWFELFLLGLGWLALGFSAAVAFLVWEWCEARREEKKRDERK